MGGDRAGLSPPQSLVVSTGRAPDHAASDARYPQPVDRAAIRATRLRTLNGLALWTWRAGRPARPHAPGVTWGAALEPAGDPARRRARRRGPPHRGALHGPAPRPLGPQNRRPPLP